MNWFPECKINHPKYSFLRICGLFLFFILISPHLNAQSSFGGYPSSIKWNQINTPLVRVIYPDSLEDKAQRVANIIHYLNEENVGLLGNTRKKVDVVLRNNDVISNGYAQIAPLKTEFFMQAPQNTFEESAVDWTDQLALHEYRHINQFLNARQGIVGDVVYYLFGDYGWGGIIGVTLPAWFLEGDATLTETALTAGGRGRVPSFSVRQRAQQLEGTEYSYMKAMNGSYKDFVPNQYNTGYLILSEMRRTARNKDFDEITRQAANFKGVLYPFKKAVKRVTGQEIKEHYFTASANLKSSIPSKDQSNSTLITSQKPQNVVQFSNPVIDKDGLYFSYSDRRDLRGLYRFSEDGKHKRITYQGIALDSYFSKYEQLFAWSEIQRDIRRGNQNYANIIVYNAETKKKRIIGRGQAYRSPSFSRDGKNLIFVNGYLGTTSGIMMYNLATNASLEITKSSTRQFLYPVQSEDGKSIYTIVKEGHYYALAEVSMKGELNLLTKYDDVVFGPLRISDGHLIFQANTGVRDQIHAYDLSSRSLKVISDDPIGMYNPSNYYDGKIVAERYYSQGKMLHEIRTTPSEWKTAATSRSFDLPYYLQTDHLEPNNILDKVPSEDFEVSRYPRNPKVIRPHSWLLNTDGTEYSATLFSDNILNQVSIQPSYTYNSNVKGSFIDLNINYGRWFPIYQLSYTYAPARTAFSQDSSRSFTVSQHSLSPGFIVPLNLTKGTYSSIARIATSVSQVWSSIRENQTNENFDQENTTLSNIVTFSHTRFRQQQNLLPRWGFSTLVRNRHRFDDSHNALNLANDFYVPGFHRNHGFKFEVDFALQNEAAEERVALVDVFNYAHGFRSVNFERIWSFNTNYALPIAYPDWGFADFVYLKRIKSNLYHNYNNIMFDDRRTELQSVGLDLLFDIVFVNNVFSEITVGFRNGYMAGPLPNGKKNRHHFDFIIDIPAF